MRRFPGALPPAGLRATARSGRSTAILAMPGDECRATQRRGNGRRHRREGFDIQAAIAYAGIQAARMPKIAAFARHRRGRLSTGSSTGTMPSDARPSIAADADMPVTMICHYDERFTTCASRGLLYRQHASVPQCCPCASRAAASRPARRRDDVDAFLIHTHAPSH